MSKFSLAKMLEESLIYIPTKDLKKMQKMSKNELSLRKKLDKIAKRSKQHDKEMN